jgi:ATP-dependent helicase/nuclease subunit A
MAARLAGRLTHTLLQRLPALPPERRAAAARAFVDAGVPTLDAIAGDRIIAETLNLLDDPTLAPLFGPGSRAEVGVSGRVRIDRDRFRSSAGSTAWPCSRRNPDRRLQDRPPAAGRGRPRPSLTSPNSRSIRALLGTSTPIGWSGRF